MKGITVFFVFFLFTFSYGQDFNGTAYYSSMSNVTTTIGDPNATTQEQKDLNEQIRKAMQKEFRLDFNKRESLFTEIDKLSTPDGKKGIEVIGIGSNAVGGLYKNIAENRIIESKDGFGKLFLIDDELKQYNWVLEDETRQVGEYLCNKASILIEKKVLTDGINEKGEIIQKEQIITTSIVAWYTRQLPISHGPSEYWGLPGLIIELNTGMLTYICTSIEINNNGLQKIKKPKKGKKITRKEFDVLYMKKLKEMQDMYTNQRKKEDE